MSKRQTIHSNTYRFFVAPSAFQDDLVQIDDPDLARQISTVLRLGPGDRIVLLDGLGWQYTVELSAGSKGRVHGQIQDRSLAAAEPNLALTLYVGLMRAERFEWLLQKGTELGARAIVPVICERSAADGNVGAAKLARWERIIREAAEQCRRGRLPTLAQPCSFTAACTQARASGPALLLWEGQEAQPIRTALRAFAPAPSTLGLLSGPEGGITETERALARTHAIVPVTLGPRTLRAETAPLVAATAALYEYGELGDPA